MILRDAFFGIRRFSQFKQRLGITQAVLSARLSHLVEHELLRRNAIGEDGLREEYRLTAKGRALLPIVVAFMQWGDQWIHGDTGAPLLLLDQATGRTVDALTVTADGRITAADQLAFAAGPGATMETKQLVDRIGRRRQQNN